MFPLPVASIDLVFCGMALGHLPQLGPSLNEIARVLEPGGVALVSDLHPCIAQDGGQRTFTAPGGKTYTVEHYIHRYADYHRAAQDAGLRVDAVTEPCLDDGDVPVVVVYRFRRG